MKKIYQFFILIVLLQVNLLPSITAQCDLNVTIAADPPAPFCTGETVTLNPIITGGTAPYSYLWETGETTPTIQVVIGIDEHVTLVVTDDNGCTDEYIIKLSAWMDVINIEWSPTVCEGEELEVSVYISPITPGAVIEWSNGQSGLYNYITNSGTYSVTVTNPDDGCSLSDTADIDVNFVPSPAPQIMGPSVLCQGQSATLSINADPNDFILWSTGSQQTTTTINGPGTYTVLVSNSDFCTGYDTLVVSSGGALPILDGPVSLCSGQSGSVSVTNASEFSSFVWSTGGNAPSIAIIGSGNYSVTVSDAGGCTATGSFTVAAGSSNINISGNTTSVTSCTTPNGAVGVTASPTGSYTYLWSNGATTEDLTNITAGSYTVTVTDNGGCTSSASFAVANNTTPPVLSATSTPDNCGQNLGSINQAVSPAGAYTFIWSNGATTEDLTNIAAGTYTVTTTSTATGCTATASTTVSNNTVNIGVTGVITQPTNGQNNGAIDITASPTGTYAYIWSNGATTEDLTGLAEGTYTVTVSGGGNCTATASFLLAAAGCQGFTGGIANPGGTYCLGTFTLESIVVGGTMPYTYNWSTGGTGPTETIVLTGAMDVTLTVTDDMGCTFTNTLHMKPFFWQQIVEVGPPSCEGQPVQLSVYPDLPFYDYLWSTGETNFSISVTTLGTYTVTISDDVSGCTKVLEAIPTFLPGLDVSIDGPATLCPGQTATLSTQGGPFSSYSWSPNGETTPTISINGPGNYGVTVSDGVNCDGSSEIQVLPEPVEAPQMDAPATICQGSNATINILNSGQYVSFLWNNGETTASISANGPGTYLVTVTNAGGCTATGSSTINLGNSNINIAGTVLPTTSCVTFNGGIDINASPAGTYAFSWSNGFTVEDLTNLAAGSYSVTVTEQNGCTASESFVVAENVILPNPSTTATPETCGQDNGAIELTVSPVEAYSYFWSNGETMEDPANLVAGNYEVTITSIATGCTAIASAIVQDNAFTPNITGAASPNNSCAINNGSITTSVSPGGSYTFAWSNGASTPDLAGLAAGDYTVTVSAGGNCTNSASFTVEDNASLPTLSSNILPSVCGEAIGEIDLQVTPAGNYVFDWSNGANTEDLIDLLPGNYTVLVTATVTGCTATATYSVTNNSSSFTLSGSSMPVTDCGAPNGQVDLNVSPAGTYDFLWSNGDTTEDLQGIAAGTYTVTVTQAGVCTGEASFQVNAQVAVPVLSQNSSPAGCGLPNGSVDLSVTPNVGNSFSWSNGEMTEDLPNVAAGNYTVTVTGSNGCTATTSATVLENNPTITLMGTATANSDCTSPNGNIDLTASPTGAYTFVWSNGEITEDLQNIAAGSYTVTVSAGGNCTSTAIFTVTNSTGTSSLTTLATPATCGQNNGGVDLTVTASPPSSYTFIWSDGATSEDLQNVSPGTYIVTCTDANGCTATASADVANVNTNFSLTATPTANSSCQSVNGQIDLTTSPSGNYDIIWSNGATTEDLVGISAGSYSVTVTDASGCSDVATALVTGPVQPQVVIGGPAATCAGVPASLSATTGFESYLWSNGETNDAITVSQSGTYSVTATDADGCTASANLIFNNFPQPTPNISGPTSICGGSTQFTVSGGVFTQINWSTGETTPSITVSQSDNYVVTVTDLNGCSATDSQTLAIGTSLQPNIGTSAACDGTASLDAGAGYANYLWSNGGISQVLSVNGSGNYSVTVSDGTGCTGETSVQISIPTPPQVAISGAGSICQGGSVQFSVPNIFTQIIWSTGEVTPSINVLQSDTYGVTVTDANGCTAAASQTLTVGAGISPSITSTLTDCNGSTSLDAGLGYASYLWSNGSTLQNISVSTNGIFTVTVTDASGCTGSASQTVSIPVPPQVQVVGASQICEGDATVLAAPGNFVQYLWSNGETMPQITVTQGGIYAVTVSDSNGCTASSSWPVTQLMADFTLLQTTACSPLDTGTVTTLLTNQFGCDSVVVLATALAQPIFTQIELQVCEGENAVFNGVEIPAGSSQSFVFAGANGCDSTVYVNVAAFPAVSFELQTSVACQGLPNGSIAVLMLSGEQPYQFSLNGGAYQPDTLFTGLPSGNYTITAQDGNGCIFPENVNIPAIPPMVVEVADETLVCGETVLLKPMIISVLDVDWQWSDSSGVVSTADRLLVNSPGTYFFTVANACESVSGEIQVAVEPLKQADLIYLPNSFSPNDDGLNDCYRGYVDPKLDILDYELKIFDRWGDQVFNTTEVDGCWDGWYRGKEMDTDVLVYWVRMLVRNCDGQEVDVFRKGDVHLMR